MFGPKSRCGDHTQTWGSRSAVLSGFMWPSHSVTSLSFHQTFCLRRNSALCLLHVVVQVIGSPSLSLGGDFWSPERLDTSPKCSYDVSLHWWWYWCTVFTGSLPTSCERKGLSYCTWCHTQKSLQKKQKDLQEPSVSCSGTGCFRKVRTPREMEYASWHPCPIPGRKCSHGHSWKTPFVRHACAAFLSASTADTLKQTPRTLRIHDEF